MENYSFYKTESFASDHGSMIESELKLLKEEIAAGKGDILPEGGGLRTISIKMPQGQRAEWFVVYAIYKKLRLVILLTKFKKNIKRILNSKEERKLCEKKLELDKIIESNF